MVAMYVGYWAPKSDVSYDAKLAELGCGSASVVATALSADDGLVEDDHGTWARSAGSVWVAHHEIAWTGGGVP